MYLILAGQLAIGDFEFYYQVPEGGDLRIDSNDSVNEKTEA